MVVNIHEAKTTLSKLLNAALNGEDVIIAKAGKPIVRLQLIAQQEPSSPGRFKGQINTDEFFAPLDEDELSAWEA